MQSKGIIQIAAGTRHVLALSSSELVYAWGENNYGQLGDGTVENSILIKEIHILRNRRIVQVSVSECASFAVSIHGELFVWGSNEKHVHGHPSASGKFHICLYCFAKFLKRVLISSYGFVAISFGDFTGCHWFVFYHCLPSKFLHLMSKKLNRSLMNDDEECKTRKGNSTFIFDE